MSDGTEVGDSVVSADGDAAVAGPATAPRARGPLRVLLLSLKTAARQLPRLAIPTIAVMVPMALAAEVAYLLTIGHDGNIVNGHLVAFSASTAMLVVTIIVVAAGLVSHVVALAATMVITAGVLVDRQADWKAALGSAVRRTGTLLALLPVVVLAVAVPLTVAMAVTWVTHNPWVGLVAMAITLRPGCWSLLAIPLALLEHTGPVRAVRRVFAVRRFLPWHTTVALLLGVLVVPGALVAAARWTVLSWEGVALAVPAWAIYAMAYVAAVVLQATTLTIVTLNQEYAFSPHTMNKKPGSIDLAMVAARLPAPTPHTYPKARRPWWAVSVVVLTTPGLLYGAYLWINPLALPVINDHVFHQHSVRGPVALDLLPGDHSAGYVGQPGSSGDRSVVGMCGDPTCRGSRLHAYGVGHPDGRVATTTLPDGSLGLAGWDYDPATQGTSRPQALIRLGRCTTQGCETIGTTKLTRPDDSFPDWAVAMTAAGDGLLIATAPANRKRSGGWLRLTRCDDRQCQGSRTLISKSLSGRVSARFANDPIALALGPKGRPVVAAESRFDGAIMVMSCDDAACHRPSVTERRIPPAESGADGDDDTAGIASQTDGVDVVVPADDRPIIAYRTRRSGEPPRLMRCRTSDCSQVDTLTLTESGPGQPPPALALGADGLPLIATHDMARRQVVVIACHDMGCTRRTKASIATFHHGPGNLDLTVGRDKRPRILWADQPLDTLSEGPLHLTTCAGPRCGA